MKDPLVSIIVPTKNSAEFLEACLQSIKDQTYDNIELIVVDNFSTDNTPEIAKRFTKHFYSKGPERSAQRNYAVNRASGKYVAIIDSDMELSPKVITVCMDRVNTAGTNAVIIPEESFGLGFWAQCKKLERSFYVGNDAIEAARFFKTSLYKELGGYDETMVSGEDWDLSYRAAQIAKIGRITEFIMHNEGHLKLSRTLRKKYYYAGLAANYLKKNKIDSALTTNTGPLQRYRLFFSKPKKLFRDPLLGLGMLCMKTSEFIVGGIGLLIGAKNKHV